MGKKNIIGIIVFVILLIVVSIFLVLPQIREAKIKAAIKKANYCQIDSDCVDAGGKCPFGCYAYVNKNEVEKISNLIQSFDSKCVYGCVSCPTPICLDGKCKEVCEK